MKVNHITPSAVEKAGKALRIAKPASVQYVQAILLVNKWRYRHAAPMDAYKSSLKRKTRLMPKVLVAQRLKRMPTIIDKLHRYPHMSLARMSDVGGVRGIFPDIKKVRETQKFYETKSKYAPTLYKVKDYLDCPKPDGYRGIHLIFKFRDVSKTKTLQKYDGTFVEMQLRSSLQHNWATAVETVGLFRAEALKSGTGAAYWLEFFKLVSNAFAHIEGTSPLEEYEHLSITESFERLAKFEAKHDILTLLKSMSMAVEVIQKNNKGYYHVITLNPAEKSVTIGAYAESDLVLATKDYEEKEARAALGEKIETVLVSVNKIKSLKKAYPNYFLDIRDFVDKVKIITAETRQ